MNLQDELNAARAEVIRLEAEVAALPGIIAGKTESELVQVYHAIVSFFRGSVPAPAVVEVAAVDAKPVIELPAA
jgi:hypothetical protein